MDISFKGNFKSLSSFEWKNIPSLAIISGLNGSGKSQLLNVIMGTYNDISRNSRLTEHTGKEFVMSISGVDLDKDGMIFWQPNGINPNLSLRKFGYEDLKFLTQFILFQMRHDFQKRDRIFSQVRTSSGNTGRELFKDAIKLKSPIIINEILERTGKSSETISAEEISYHFPEEILLEDFDLFQKDSLEMIFYFYIYKKVANEKQGLGIPISPVAPWEIINKVIEEAGLPYQITEPDETIVERIFTNALNEFSSDSFSIKLVRKKSKEEIGFQNLSSGERVILSLSLLLYYSENRGLRKKLLILDEPDAHLHPSLTKQFFDVVDNVLIRQYGARVIMTTHSPSTISLAPESNHCQIYKLSKEPTKIEPVQDRYELISDLSDGLLVVSPKTKYIVVEGKSDKPFFESVYKTAIREKCLKKYPPMVFIPGTNKDSVKHWVKEQREIGNADYHGIIDKDQGNEPSDGIKVLNRYSIENYLLDPINVYVTSTTRIPELSKFEIQKGEEETVTELDQKVLQSISNSVLQKVEPSIKGLTAELRDEVLLEYMDGRKIKVPKWFISKRGKDLLVAFQKHFGGPSAINPPSLLANIKRTKLIPKEIVELLSLI